MYIKKTIVTRSQNNELYAIFKSLWNDNNIFVQRTDFPGYTGALDYLLHLFTDEYSGWIVNVDEDFFLTNEKLMDDLLLYMQENDFAYCGVPDGHVISHRNNSIFNVNPFFNIFNVDLIKTKIKKFDNSRSFEYGNRVEKNAILNEPFAGFLYWLHLNFKHTSFTHIESTDGVSTVIKLNDKPLGIHSWYSRHYGKDLAQTERIDRCIEWAIINRA
jgi:hypothetical protein